MCNALWDFVHHQIETISKMQVRYLKGLAEQWPEHVQTGHLNRFDA
jgi:hypothetical protein